MSLKFRYTILYVDDVPATLSFYELAFGAETQMLHEGKDYGELSTGGTTLAFSSRTLLRQLGRSPQAPEPAVLAQNPFKNRVAKAGGRQRPMSLISTAFSWKSVRR